jgi:hypothetical protein
MPEPATLATVVTAPPAAGSPAAPPQPAAPAAVKPATPDAKAWADMSPDARAAHQRTVSDAGRTSASLHTRTPDGRPLIDGKLADGTTYQPDGQNAPADSAAPAAAGEKFKVGEYEITAEELGAMMQRQATDDLHKAALPAGPELYEARLPEGFKLPAGIEYKFDMKDPSLIAAQNLAHAKGWSQQDFSEALGIFASHYAGQEAALQERARAEIAKVGPNAPQRVDFVGKWLDGFMGTKDAAPIRATLVTDAHVRFIERVIDKLTNQGAASFSQQHRDVEPRGVSDEQWNGMSYSQKKAYAEKMSSQANGRR